MCQKEAPIIDRGFLDSWLFSNYIPEELSEPIPPSPLFSVAVLDLDFFELPLRLVALFFVPALAGARFAAFLGAAFFAVDFLAAAFLGAAFLAVDFFAVVRLAAAFLGAAFLAVDFLAVVRLAAAFLGAAFLAVVFFAVVRLAAAFLGAAFLAVDFLATAFLAVVFLPVAFLAVVFLAAAFLGAAFLAVAFLAVDFLAVAFLAPPAFLVERFAAFLGFAAPVIPAPSSAIAAAGEILFLRDEAFFFFGFAAIIFPPDKFWLARKFFQSSDARFKKPELATIHTPMPPFLVRAHNCTLYDHTTQHIGYFQLLEIAIYGLLTQKRKIDDVVCPQRKSVFSESHAVSHFCEI